DAAAPQRLGGAFRERDEASLALPDEFGHAADAVLDRYVRIDARHAINVKRLDAEIFQALFAGSAQITRIATAQAVGAAITRTAALRVNLRVVPAAADRFADQPMIVALAITRGRVQ